MKEIIHEEYKLWRKNIPYIYDIVISHSLSWPSLSVQWFPDATRNSSKNTTTQRLLLTTHTSQKDTEYLQIASLTIPDLSCEDGSQYEKEDLSNVGDGKLKIIQKIIVENEINRARYSPLACNIIAARSDAPETELFDYTKHKSNETIYKPDAILTGQESGGYGLSWNHENRYELATADENGLICIFDISSGKQNITPKLTLKEHKEVVNEVTYNFINTNQLVSVSDDKSIIMWDTRSGKCTVKKNAHSNHIHTIAFSPIEEHYIATGGKDGVIHIWDIRNMERHIFGLVGHSGEIMQTQWSPHFNGVLASSATDRRVIIWDIKRANTSSDVKSPEKIFLHGGHTNNVCDFSWNPLEPWEIASVAEDNVVQIWQPSKNNLKDYVISSKFNNK